MGLEEYAGVGFSDMILAGYMNAQFSAAQELEFLLRILAACACGGIIGYERGRRLKEAGLRTHVIVCFAAALMIIVSKYGFVDMTALDGTPFAGTRGGDPSRIAAQVVSGMGFLGAGAIFKSGNTIKGLTTAAGLWATAGIGLVLGAGMYILGITSTLMLIAMQFFMHHVTPLGESMEAHQMTFTIAPDEDFQDQFKAYLETLHVQISESVVTHTEDGLLSCKLMLKCPDGAVQRMDDFLHVHGKVHTVTYAYIA